MYEGFRVRDGGGDVSGILKPINNGSRSAASTSATMSYRDFLTAKATVSKLAKKALDLLNESEALLSAYSSDDESEKNNIFFDEDSDIQVRFEDLNLSPELMKGLCVEMKFVRPTKIQSISLPMILTPPYKNVIARAPILSGKTTCFVLAMLNRVDPTLPAPQALCLCPTRPHATQAMEVVLKMAKFTGITSYLFFPADRSEARYNPVSKRAPVTAQVVIISPGTACELIADNKLDTCNLKIIVFEEADLMLVGYEKVAVRILKETVRCSPECQVLLFSTRFSDAPKSFVSTLAKDLSLREFHQLFVDKEELSLGSFKQYKVYLHDEVSKIMVIRDKILELGDGVWQTVIYVRAKTSAQILHEALVKYGYAVTTTKGTLVGEDRDRVFKELKEGSTRILISADLLFSGFDQSRVNLVVNYDLPVKSCKYYPEPDYKVYLQRVGRAGRFGRKGAVFNLVCDGEDRVIMEKIERHFNHDVTEVPSWTSDDDVSDALKKAGLM